MFTVAAEGEGNQLTVNVDSEMVVLDVHSQRGIGNATIELASGAPPNNIVIRLHLKGLEEFRLSYGQQVVTARVSSGDNSIAQSIVSPNGDEQALANDSPFWMNIGIVADQGYFEIRLPKDVLHEGRRSFAIRWVDFYR